eukprot:gb/GECG01000295.1/.p1 GENE.gb/GECG01000295.1/~~gb/GECG01000295.1/.p1  ORF type:complete len:183 (+),score=38.17 gb/GECG01000295.1/:1-549(+)
MDNGHQEYMHEEETVMEGSGGSPEDQYFDRVVGALEKIVLSEDFRHRHETFCRTNCKEFDEHDTEENKLSYMELFERYTSMLESMLEEQLTAEVPDFDMERFQEMLSERGDELNADIFDLLISMGDFEEFKSLMISYKQQVEYEESQGQTTNMSISNAENRDPQQSAPIAPTTIKLSTEGKK